MSRLLLTGATGFLGQRFLELFGEEIPIVALVRRNRPRGRLAGLVYGDLRSREDVFAAARDCSAILHVGGATPNRAYADGGFGATTLGMRHLVAAAEELGIRRFVFVSSACVEFAEPGPYARSKRDAEACLVRSSLDWTILRPGTILGPQGVDLGRTLRYWRRARVVPMIGDGRYCSQPVDVDDLALACRNALREPRSIRRLIPVAGEDSLSFRDFARQFLRALGNPQARLLPVPRPLVMAIAAVAGVLTPRLGLNPERVRIITSVHRADTGAMRELLGVRPRPFAESVQRVVAGLPPA